MAAATILGMSACIVSTETVPGETGPEGKPGDSPWKDEATHIHYDDAAGAELARFSGEHPETFTGSAHTIVLGGDATTPDGNLYTTVAFGSMEPNVTIHGGIGVKIATSGSRMILGTSNDYGKGVTNEAITIDEDANVSISASAASIQKFKDIGAEGQLRSGEFHVSAVSNSGDGYSFTSARSDGSAPTSIHGNAGGEIWFQVEGGTPGALDPTPAILITRDRVVSIAKVAPDPQYHLDVGGAVNAAAYHVNGQPFCANCMPSDARLKKNVAPLPDALSRLLRLRGVTYEWIEPEKHGNQTGPQPGMIAQEVEQVFPEWVSNGNDGMKTLQLRGFEALAVESLRELSTRNERLEKQVAALTSKLDTERAAREKLEARLAALEAAAATISTARR